LRHFALIFIQTKADVPVFLRDSMTQGSLFDENLGNPCSTKDFPLLFSTAPNDNGADFSR
jgi:hypothetical protein